jgi:hypothetical protein
MTAQTSQFLGEGIIDVKHPTLDNYVGGSGVTKIHNRRQHTTSILTTGDEQIMLETRISYEKAAAMECSSQKKDQNLMKKSKSLGRLLRQNREEDDIGKKQHRGVASKFSHDVYLGRYSSR